MQKLIRSGLCAAAAALLTPMLLLSAVGAMRSEAPAEPAQETAVAPVRQTLALPRPSEASPQRFDARQTVALQTDSGVRTLPLSEYLTGVVMGELPASFADAAVAAQVVAARTVTLRQMLGGKHDGQICADASCCQAWCDPAVTAMGETADWAARVTAAVEQTDGQVLTYDGELIEAVFFSCSGGRTEDAAAVWGGDVPYLVSVDSPGEESAPRYDGMVSWSAADFRRTVLSEYPAAMLSGPPETWLGAVQYTDGGGVDALTVGGQAIPGTALRRMLGLNSTCFTVTVEGENLHFTTRGFGHRVGMSQYGANAMAQAGADYAQILAHYYTGAKLTTAQ